MLIGRIDRSVDRLVYDLYELMEEEVKTIEESLESEYGRLPRRGGGIYSLIEECETKV